MESIGISLYKNLANIKNIAFSDISKDAIIISKKNEKANKIDVSNVDFFKSNIFSNFDKQKFDIIINDISGISESVAKISPWFKNIPCSSGINGTVLTLRFLKKL